MLSVVALWIYNGQIQKFHTDPYTGAGRLVGLIAADLLLIQVLLMARVPVIERSFGQDELARRHRLVGFSSFNLLLVHIALIIIGYAGGPDKVVSGGVHTAVDLTLNYPGMLLAVVAFALLVMVVITSVRMARAKLRYENWHLLHLYAYLGVGLSIPHEIWSGADFTASKPARLYWWTMYAVAAGAVIVYRVLLPMLRSRRHQLVVDQVVEEAPGMYSVYMRGHQLHRLRAQAGQFFNWRFKDGPGWTAANPYSLSAAPSRDLLRITVKDQGDGSSRAGYLRPGTPVIIEGPYGRLTGDVRTQAKVTLIASGIGITPLRALLEGLDYRPGDATLIYRARNAESIAFEAELNELADRRGAQIFYSVGPRLAVDEPTWLPQSAAHLSDDEALLQLVPDIARHDVYICGAPAWMEAAHDAALAAGVPIEQIHLERFSW
jgi:predicted ferric reductase